MCVLTCQCVLTLNFLACKGQSWGFGGFEKFRLAVVYVSVCTPQYDVTPLSIYSLLNYSELSPNKISELIELKFRLAFSLSIPFNFPRDKYSGKETCLSQFSFCFLLHLQLDSPCTSNDFVNDVWAAPPFSTHILQSVAQHNPIKWLLMNFQQVLSPGSACTTLRCPLTLQSIHVSHGSAYQPSSVMFLGHAKCLFVALFLCCSSFSVCWFYFCVFKTSSGNVLHWSCSKLNDLSLSSFSSIYL